MSASNEWTEYHLTSEGWVRGSEKTDFSLHIVPDPVGSVAVFRYCEHLSSPFSRMDQYAEKVRVAGPQEVIDQLVKQFGSCPQHL